MITEIPSSPTRGDLIRIGLLAGFDMTLLMLVMRIIFEVESLPEIIANGVTRIMPIGVFSLILQVLHVFAKPLLFTGLCLTQIGICGLLALGYPRIIVKMKNISNRHFFMGVVYVFPLWILILVVLSPGVGAGFAGSDLAGGPVKFSTTVGISVAAYGVLLGYFYKRLSVTSMEKKAEGRFGRRDFLKRGVFWGVVIGSASYGSDFILRRVGPLNPLSIPTGWPKRHATGCHS